ncbi:hypothetical protein LguiA_013856 [Lonicera macranthoides]
MIIPLVRLRWSKRRWPRSQIPQIRCTSCFVAEDAVSKRRSMQFVLDSNLPMFNVAINTVQKP